MSNREAGGIENKGEYFALSNRDAMPPDPKNGTAALAGRPCGGEVKTQQQACQVKGSIVPLVRAIRLVAQNVDILSLAEADLCQPLIEYLDSIDGDADLEGSLGWSDCWRDLSQLDLDADFEVELAELDLEKSEGDDEPWLAWDEETLDQDRRSWGDHDFEAGSDDEPQLGWGAGKDFDQSELHASRDDLERDTSDFEYSFGSCNLGCGDLLGEFGEGYEPGRVLEVFNADNEDNCGELSLKILGEIDVPCPSQPAEINYEARRGPPRVAFHVVPRSIYGAVNHAGLGVVE